MIKDNICPVCNSEKSKLEQYPLRNDNSFQKCKNCGVIIRAFKSKVDEKRLIASHYDNVDPSGSVALSRTKLFQTIFYFLGKPDSEAKLLDVGCGRGYFLDKARQNGWNSSGIDITSSACLYAKKHFNIDVFCGDLQSARLKDNSFDAVTIIDALYQFSDPKGTLREIARILKAGGVLYIRVKNVKFQLQLNRFFLKTAWILKPIINRNPAVFHNINFTAKSLRLLLENNGFLNYRISNSIITKGDPYFTGKEIFVQLMKYIYFSLTKFIEIISMNKIFIGASLDVVAKK